MAFIKGYNVFKTFLRQESAFKSQIFCRLYFILDIV